MKLKQTLILFLLSLSSIYAESTPTIQVIISSDNSIYEQALFGLQTSLQREIKVDYYDLILNEFEEPSRYFQNLEKKGIQIVITLGKTATKYALDAGLKIPIVFSMINFPKGLSSNPSQLCGMSMHTPIEFFFQTLREFSVSSKNVYAFYSSDEGNYSTEEGEHYDLKYKLIFQRKKITRTNLTKELKSLEVKPDAIFIPADPLYDAENFGIISKYSLDNSIILMSSFPALVKSGATFGINPDYTAIGIETGEMVNRILSKQSSCEIEGIQLPKQFNFILNESYAKASNIPLSNPILERAKNAKLYSLGIQLLNEERWKSAKSVFDSILKSDPNNQSAKQYQQLTIEKISGSKVREIIRSAKEFFAIGNFAQSRAEYKKALDINPNLEIAKDGYLNATIAQSEKERNRGNSLKTQGNSFEAIKSYLESIQTYPQNQTAKNELDSLRKSEYSKIPNLLQNGIQFYQEREYEEAIDRFEKVLLIDPSEKTAQEYLRLSIKKRDALKALERRQQ
ncbi:oligopeptide ABC transporter, oligopeptide-binding protein [Leptospira ryugenii]|uniref:Oligopeptide ABC transporter, oligopeptide-binding protein n=1 Tax=Leptospira ryugenii TaxID=1917863 RepID=A0A2P2DZ05_9LEPT|nr:ABC transporter substrate binding protein [Leptospira ryugenii]GBF49826.1 oligopeptide ABC transporter, oligopeptide-binding protein [Leptospira ryugenii]